MNFLSKVVFDHVSNLPIIQDNQWVTASGKPLSFFSSGYKTKVDGETAFVSAIVVNTNQVTEIANRFNLSYEESYKQVVLPELGRALAYHQGENHNNKEKVWLYASFFGLIGSRGIINPLVKNYLLDYKD